MAILIGTLTLTAFFSAQGASVLVGHWSIPIENTPSIERSRTETNLVSAGRAPRDPWPILERNIFDSETGPILKNPPVDPDLDADTETAETELEADKPLLPCATEVRLVGSVRYPGRPDLSFASIAGSSGTALLYRTGMEIDGNELLDIFSTHVVLRPGRDTPCLALMFDTESKATPNGGRTTPREDRPVRVSPSRRRQGAISDEELESGISRVSDSQFNVTRSLLDKILENQADLIRTARIIPHEENGRVIGVKLYGIRRNSLLGRLGLQNGDMMRTINGFDMSQPDSALEAYSRLRNADNLSVALIRRGNPMTVDYNIR
ncbi:MAG: type II secretion system protein GspC [Myxococcota bacterium]